MGMARLASPKTEKDTFRLLLAMQLRPSEQVQRTQSEQLELAALMRKEREQAEIAKKDKELELASHPKTGEMRTVPVTTTTIEGIGSVGAVHYGIITYEVTSNGVKAEKRSVWGENLSGFVTFNE